MVKNERAVESIRALLRMAEAELRRNPELSSRYVRHAWRIKMARAMRLPVDIRRMFCRRCLTVWVPGLTCRVRLKKGRLTVTCVRCGRVVRLPYKK
ncbi:MAG: hypothetical protein QXG10_03140 [Candidatus Hadarchaeales archaeon]